MGIIVRLVAGLCGLGLCGAAEISATPHWAFEPVKAPELPVMTYRAWCRNAVDAFLGPTGESPATMASRRTLIRRATLDLTGLPPTAEEIEAFEADPAPDAFAQRVDRLLDSPRYGEHWGRHWLDVVRYADTAGETADYPVPVAWRYRNYVIQAFNADKPYDEFIREQVAGDILALEGSRERYAERVTATGFLAISRRFGFDSENYHHLTIQDTIDTVGQSVLGLTLGCARCHAHKYDPVSTTDYYALYGIFESTRYAFPGSEQKTQRRALSPLVPPGEPEAQWRAFENRVAGLTAVLERPGADVPSALLRSLDDLDGDFEMQAPAAGGSYGVLVPPWTYLGKIAVQNDAQSPFKNLHPMGRVGAHVPGGTNQYRIGQALRLAGPGADTGRGKVFVNLDCRVATNDLAAAGRHRFWLGSSTAAAAAVEVLIGRDTVEIRTGTRVDLVRSTPAGQWFNVQLELDLAAGTVSGVVGMPGDTVGFEPRAMAPEWDGRLEFVATESMDGSDSLLPGISVDNIGVQTLPIPAVSRTRTEVAGLVGPGVGALEKRLSEVSGLDGDFELQSEGAPPAAPWHPGPKSVVTIQTGAQSPITAGFPPGRQGIRLPNSGAYNGFGQTLQHRWQASVTPALETGFDFRCADVSAGGDGSWRFYLGHGAGSSPAVELFLNGSGFFRRSGTSTDRVAPLAVGEWYRVRLALDLKARHYTGTLTSTSGSTGFSGDLASGWDGQVDYTFIDSYGHLGGVKPALDVDHFVVREAPVASLAATTEAPPAITVEAEAKGRAAEVAALRQQIDQAKQREASVRRELEALIADGPVPMAYAVSEGTPHNARLQIRGEPDRLGDEVPRGLPTVLGGGPLPAGTRGSGRRELADWLTSPQNPLTARVMVNRIWLYHFGQGLVRTPNDFGMRGQPPENPALLDHLASEFVKSGWSVKAMHRLIMNSAAYQANGAFRSVDPGQRSAEVEECPVVDGETGKMGRAQHDATASDASSFPRRRMGAEELRDSILLVSGELDESPGEGHPFPAPTSWGYTQHGPFNAVYDHHRRSVYLMTQRIKRHPFLALFDGADPNASTPERRLTLVPTQALFFLNDPFVHTNSARLAARVAAGNEDAPAQVRSVYRRVLGRNPAPAESNDALRFLARYREELAGSGATAADDGNRPLAAYIRVLFGSNEFLTVD